MAPPNKKLAPAAWDALAEALATYEWYKRPFESLVRRLFADATPVIARLNFDDPKRRVAGELCEGLRARESDFQDLVLDALLELAAYDPAFPSLARLDDGTLRVSEAQQALARVRAITDQFSEVAKARELLQAQLKEHAGHDRARRHHEEALEALRQQFLTMMTANDPHKRGKEFEGLLNNLFRLWDLEPRAAYDLAHEQIDGSFTFRTDDYLLEARWWKENLQPKELNDFKAKVDGKARNTLGLCIAVTGFTQGAIEKHSSAQSPLILMDGVDLMPILEGRISLDEVLERKRRHAAETGNVLFRVPL